MIVELSPQHNQKFYNYYIYILCLEKFNLLEPEFQRHFSRFGIIVDRSQFFLITIE